MKMIHARLNACRLLVKHASGLVACIPAYLIILLLIGSLGVPCAFSSSASTATRQVVSVEKIGTVWGGHPVGFCLLTHGTNQYAAYYNTNRQMTVVWRRLPNKEWTTQLLPSHVKWDSHNYITMAVDSEGCLHVSGNMHVNPLVYFKSSKPWDATTLTQITNMVGTRESRCTYPRFFRGPNKELIFSYRDGRSGNGDQILNVYDEKAHQWKHLIDTPLFDGQGQMNAYAITPTPGPDGFYHLCWVWRDTPDCSSNHDLSYARSKDLVTWFRSNGTPISLPIKLQTGEIIDPVPVRAGLLNGNLNLTFDQNKRPMVTYHKFDTNGFTQAFVARLENGQWVSHQTSDWSYRWDFSGGGSIHAEIHLGPILTDTDGELYQSYSHARHGSATWLLDKGTLKTKGTRKLPNPIADYDRQHPDLLLPGLQSNTASDIGPGENDKTSYVLRWQTLGANRDKPRTEPVPDPTPLRIYKIISTPK